MALIHFVTGVAVALINYRPVVPSVIFAFQIDSELVGKSEFRGTVCDATL
jgi:hypothetical protein